MELNKKKNIQSFASFCVVLSVRDVPLLTFIFVTF